MMALYALTHREIIRFFRQKSRLIGALATPLLFWLLIGAGLGTSFRDPNSDASYLQFFFPGMLALNVLFTAIFSTISVIQDRNEGFLQGVLVSPVSRWTILGSKVLGGALLGVMQALLLLGIAPFLGFSLTFGNTVLILWIVFLMGVGWTSVGFIGAWRVDSVQGYHGIMNMVLMPTWLLSGSVFPIEGSATAFQWVMKINPLTYGVSGLRDLLTSGGDNFSPISIVFLVLFSGATLIFARLIMSTRSS